MSSKKLFYLVLLVFIILNSEVKSDNAIIHNNRLEVDQYGQTTQDRRSRNQINQRQDNPLISPEEQDRNRITELGISINSNNNNLDRARQLFPHDYNEAEITTENQLRTQLDSAIRVVNEQTRETPIEQRTLGRQILIQRLIDMNNHMIRCLKRYAAVQRQREENDIKYYEGMLNQYKQREPLQRSQELPFKDQRIQIQRQEDYKIMDILEGQLRTHIQRVKERHARQLTFDEENINNILLIRNLWKRYSEYSYKIEQRRLQEMNALQQSGLVVQRQFGNGDKRKFK